MSAITPEAGGEKVIRGESIGDLLDQISMMKSAMATDYARIDELRAENKRLRASADVVIAARSLCDAELFDSMDIFDREIFHEYLSKVSEAITKLDAISP